MFSGMIRRSMSITADNATGDARYWAQQMEAVAGRGDRDAFMRIYDHFAPRLQRYVQGLGLDPGRAEELVQEALLRVWRKARQFDPRRASLTTWLFRIARNLYIDGVRKDQHWSMVDEELDRMDAEPARADTTSVEQFADNAQLTAAIDALPAEQARLIRMSYFEAKSHSEIADELDMPLGTVKSTLRRTFHKLRAQILSRP